MLLAQKLFNKVVDFLAPYLDKDERERLVNKTFLDTPIVTNLDYTGSKKVFADRLVTKLIKYGTLASGKFALVAFLETLREEFGSDRQNEIDQLITELNTHQESLQSLIQSQSTAIPTKPAASNTHLNLALIIVALIPAIIVVIALGVTNGIITCRYLPFCTQIHQCPKDTDFLNFALNTDETSGFPKATLNRLVTEIDRIPATTINRMSSQTINNECVQVIDYELRLTSESTTNQVTIYGEIIDRREGGITEIPFNLDRSTSMACDLWFLPLTEIMNNVEESELQTLINLTGEPVTCETYDLVVSAIDLLNYDTVDNREAFNVQLAALEANDQVAEREYLLGLDALNAGNYQSAADHFVLADAARASDIPRYGYEIGISYLGLGDLAAAEYYLSNQIDHTPTDSAFQYWYLSATYREMGEYSLARQVLENYRTAIEGEGVDFFYDFYLGSIAVYEEQWQSALDYLLPLTGADALLFEFVAKEYWFYVAVSQQALGNNLAACQSWREYNALEPTDEFLEDKRQQQAQSQQADLTCE